MQRLTRVGVFSFAKIMGLVGFFAGFLISIPYGLMVMVLGAGAGAHAEQGGAGLAALGVGGGLVIMIGVPIAYAGLSWFVGLIYGLIINVVLHMAGGLELRIEATR